MAELYEKLSDIFWSESFWFPANRSWKDLEPVGDEFYPRPLHMWYPLPLAVLLFALRLLWERFIALPIGRCYGLKETSPRKAESNSVLEKAYRQFGKYPPKNGEITGISKQLDWSPRQVEHWWRKRRVQCKPSEMQRFKETSWRFLFYLAAFWYGMFVLWDKPWFWDTKYCWYNHPRQILDQSIYWYYLIELAFYWSLILSLSMDSKRKDFNEMIIHHFATITLMVFSYANNMIRVGSLVLVVHDAVDWWLEGAKLAKYMKHNRLCDVLFVIFTAVWFITRLCIFPLRILYTTTLETYQILGPIYSLILFNLMLLVLQVLHIMWFCTIVHMVRAYIVKGQVEKDGRSDSEPESSDEEEKSPSAPKDGPTEVDYHANGHVTNQAKINVDVMSNNNIIPAKMK